MIGNFWKMRTRRTEGGLGRTGRQADGRMGGRADGRIRANGAWIGPTSGRANGRTSKGFKRPRTSFPTSLSCAQTTCLTADTNTSSFFLGLLILDKVLGHEEYTG